MAEVKILHCADLHIGALENFLGARAATRKIETLMTFEGIVKLALENNVQIVLIAGDLLDSNGIDSVFAERILASIARANTIKFVYAAGNHDPLGLDSPFIASNLPKNLYVLPTNDSYFEFPEFKVRVYGKSFGSIYQKGAPAFSLKTDDSFINLMCLHGEITYNTDCDYAAITQYFIESSGMDYIALGHIHKRSAVEKVGSVYFSYCGCAEGQGFDELGPKGVYMGTVSKGLCNLKFVPTAKRLHLLEKIDVSECISSDDMVKEILRVLSEKYKDSYTENLYKIVLVGAISETTVVSVAEITARLNETLYFAKVKNQTEPKIDLDALKQEKTLKGIFVNKMLEKIENANTDEKEILNNALMLGLKAFKTEVSFDEN